MSGLFSGFEGTGAGRDSGLDSYAVPSCKFCGSRECVTWRGKRANRRGRKQRFWCKRCRRRFSTKSIFDYFLPNHLDLMLNGIARTGDVEFCLSDLAMFGVSCTRTRLETVVRKACALLDEFESFLRPLVPCSALQADEVYQRFSNDEHVWILNVMDEDSRWLLASVDSPRRDLSAWRRTLARAVQLCSNYAGKEVRCDGWNDTISAILSLGLIPDSRTKQEDYGHISLIERLQATIRNLGLRKSRSFRTRQFLRMVLDTERHFYNMLRPHAALGKMTPLEYVSGLRFTKFSQLLQFAESKVRPLNGTSSTVAPRIRTKAEFSGKNGATKLSQFAVELSSGIHTRESVSGLENRVEGQILIIQPRGRRLLQLSLDALNPAA